MDHIAKTVAIGELRFQLQPLPARTAMLLDRRVAGLLAPVLKGISLDGASALDLTVLSEVVTGAVGSMTDDAYTQFVMDMFSTVTWLPAQGAPRMLTESFDAAFAANTASIYQLLIAVMEYNRFGPFVLVTGFVKKREIGISASTAARTATSG